MPFNTIEVVPTIFPSEPSVKLPPTKIELLFSVITAEAFVLLNVTFPLAVRLLVKVIVVMPEVVLFEKLFQVIPFVLSVVDVEFAALPISRVEPVVTTVPAVYVRVPP